MQLNDQLTVSAGSAATFLAMRHMHSLPLTGATGPLATLLVLLPILPSIHASPISR